MQLPHTAECLACGRDNPHGLRLTLFVDDAGVITTRFIPTQHHVGFPGVAHGGVIATVFDEAMVWAASWRGKRFCLCGELSVRFRQPALVGRELLVSATIDAARSRLITTTSRAHTADGQLIAEASAKYIPIPADQNAAFLQTVRRDAATEEAYQVLLRG